jgi:hypothetical protein
MAERPGDKQPEPDAEVRAETEARLREIRIQLELLRRQIFEAGCLLAPGEKAENATPKFVQPPA